MEIKTKTKQVYLCIFTVLAFFIVFFMHIYKLNQIPKGLYVDEASAAYDAIMLGRFGVDRWLDSFPVYLKNYGDGQNALYVYIMMFFIKILGANTFSYRIGMALSAFLVSIALYVYVRKAIPTARFLPAISVLLYAITPIFVMPQRYGLESILMMAASMFVPLFFSNAATVKSKKYVWAVLYGIICGISLYTYALTYIVLPLFLILSFIYLLLISQKRTFEGKQTNRFLHFCSFAFPLCFLAAPLLAVQAINYFDLSQKHIGPFTLTKFTSYRSADLGIQNIKGNAVAILHNIFIHGELEANDLSQFGPFFFISIPFIVLGLILCIRNTVKSLKEHSFSYDAPMIFWFIPEYIMGLFLTVKPNSTRMNGIYISLFYFEIVGLYSLYNLIRNVFLKKIYFITLSAIYIFCSVLFCRTYFANEQQLGYLFFEPYDEIVDYIIENKDETWAQRSFTYPWNYIYYMLAYQVDPYEYNLAYNTNYVFKNDITNEAEQKSFNYIGKNYILYKTDTSSFDYLKNIGYNCFSVGEWYLCISPLDSYQEAIGENIALTIDVFSDQNDSITISGWCYNKEDDTTFENYSVIVENDIYTFIPTERLDVANAFSNESLLNCGFELNLPISTLSNHSDIMLYGICKDNTEKLIYSCEYMLK